MDIIKKVYIDSGYKTNGSIRNIEFKFEIPEALDLGGNAVCYIDDISIPHSWSTAEYNNNILYIGNAQEGLSLSASVLILPPGNYMHQT